MAQGIRHWHLVFEKADGSVLEGVVYTLDEVEQVIHDIEHELVKVQRHFHENPSQPIAY